MYQLQSFTYSYNLKNYNKQEVKGRRNATPGDRSVWEKTITLARYIYHGETDIPGESPISAPSPDIHNLESSKWELSIPEDTQENLHSSSPAEIQLAANISDSDTQENLHSSSPAEIQLAANISDSDVG
ncbi:hypothetical protein DKX38_005620 [Salix brachista]|uniref:Uncharacterized protein n=1 Tax=Salix brachista TaxID=2182728 RepID=A0A5N5N231_9ROSI|nr:hypothetical protein DKX38_005620 [Salix brachista]